MKDKTSPLSPVVYRERKMKLTNPKQLQLQSLALIGIIFLFIFNYLPMFGIVLAFKEGDNVLNILSAILDSPWCGFDNFAKFLSDKNFLDVMMNTVCLNLLMMLINFPSPIIFALLLNELPLGKGRKFVQSTAVFPNFLSWVMFGGIIIALINTDSGILNDLLLNLHIVDKPVNIKGDPAYFWGLIIVTSLLKGVGWGSIIYLAAIASLDPGMYEAAAIDGVNRWQKIIYITLPSIAPTITMSLLLSLSGILNSSVDHILVFQNFNNLKRSEVIDTYVLKYGIKNAQYSYATAIGLFKSVVGIILLSTSDFISKKITGRGVF